MWPSVKLPSFLQFRTVCSIFYSSNLITAWLPAAVAESSHRRGDNKMNTPFFSSSPGFYSNTIKCRIKWTPIHFVSGKYCKTTKASRRLLFQRANGVEKKKCWRKKNKVQVKKDKNHYSSVLLCFSSRPPLTSVSSPWAISYVTDKSYWACQ